MSEAAVIFNSRFVKAGRTKHLCMACKLEIPAGYSYVRYPTVTDEGKFYCMTLCVGCAYLWKQKTGVHQECITEGEFSDRKIPNFLRKKRARFDENPEKVFREEGIVYFGKSENPVANLVVSAAEFRRSFLFFRKRRFEESKFPAGMCFALRSGVRGAVRRVQVVKTAQINGRGIGKRGNFVAVLIRDESRETRAERRETRDESREMRLAAQNRETGDEVSGYSIQRGR